MEAESRKYDIQVASFYSMDRIFEIENKKNVLNIIFFNLLRKGLLLLPVFDLRVP